MYVFNDLAEFGAPLHAQDVETLGIEAADRAIRYFREREGYAPTPLKGLPSLAKTLGVARIDVKDESERFGLGSFKALGGAYAVVQEVLEEASRRLGRRVDGSDIDAEDVRAIAETITVSCATDGNHGRSVAYGARLVGARSVIFVHSGVSQDRIDAIESFGAQTIRTVGNYDHSVAEASRVSKEQGWITVSDTSWEGYERIPGLVMQGYTAMLREVVETLLFPPTHVFIQAGVGGVAAAVAAHFSLVYREHRPKVVVVEPGRAACLLESAKAGRAIEIPQGEPTVMAMLECYAPSRIAWRILSRTADLFMTVEDEAAIDAMNRLARPLGADPAIVAGESGGVGLAGLLAVSADRALWDRLGLTLESRVLVINTEGATDPTRYRALVGLDAAEALAQSRSAWARPVAERLG